jgi:hypothetical protein
VANFFRTPADLFDSSVMSLKLPLRRSRLFREKFYEKLQAESDWITDQAPLVYIGLRRSAGAGPDRREWIV